MNTPKANITTGMIASAAQNPMPSSFSSSAVPTAPSM